MTVIEAPDLMQSVKIVCDGSARDDKLELTESMLRPA